MMVVARLFDSLTNTVVAPRSEPEVWVFGYGSLVWKQNFQYVDQVVGCIKGFKRGFWLSSEDHRGVPGKPGRVVTVIPSEDTEDEVWGVAYKIPPEEIDTTFNYLNQRERNGYTLQTLTFYPENAAAEPFRVSLYASTTDNPHFIGQAPVEEMAQQIYTAAGPSGPNLEYFLRLALFMKQAVPKVKDVHLHELENAVKKLMIAYQAG